MTVLAFTPGKFSLLAFVAVALTLGASALPASHARNANVSLADLYRPTGAIGETHGPLTASVESYDFTPTPVASTPERRGTQTPAPSPQAPTPVVHHSYPPMVR